MIRQEDVYRIGRIGKPHGVKGEVTFSFTDDVFDRTDADYLVVSIDGILVPFFMEEYRFRSEETALVKFCDIDTQDRARELTNCEVYFPRQAADTDADTCTWAELVGYSLASMDSGTVVGEITGVDDTTLNTLFEVRTPDGRDLLIPAGEDLIGAVDKARRTIHIHLPEGILDL